MGQKDFGEETRDALNRKGYTISDIEWIGSRKVEIPIDEFFEVAYHTTYDSGYGTQEMPSDLLIVMKDQSYFERREYDGAEWWEYVTVPVRPVMASHIKTRTFYPEDYYNIHRLEDYIFDFYGR